MSRPNRTLADISGELRAALTRETADLLMIGSLLIEAKAKVAHGEWLSWLKQEFSMSDRTAAKYIKAAEFADKFELGSNLNISPSALYLLSEDHYWGDGHGRHEATLAVITAARTERIGYDKAKEIVDKTLAVIAKRRAREKAMAAAMANDLNEAKLDAHERGEDWEDKEDEWIEKWASEKWGKDQEAKFEAEWREAGTPDHEPPDQAGAPAPGLPPSSSPTGRMAEQPPQLRRTVVPHTQDGTPLRSTRTKAAEARRAEIFIQVPKRVAEIMKYLSDACLEDRDREVLGRTREGYTPLQGFLLPNGKVRFNQSDMAEYERLLATGSPQGDGTSAEGGENRENLPKHDQAA
jgi:hypothetical protein